VVCISVSSGGGGGGIGAALVDGQHGEQALELGVEAVAVLLFDDVVVAAGAAFFGG
jgi:hypothetical protein